MIRMTNKTLLWSLDLYISISMSYFAHVLPHKKIHCSIKVFLSFKVLGHIASVIHNSRLFIWAHGKERSRQSRQRVNHFCIRPWLLVANSNSLTLWVAPIESKVIICRVSKEMVWQLTTPLLIFRIRLCDRIGDDRLRSLQSLLPNFSESRFVLRMSTSRRLWAKQGRRS